MLLPDEIKTLLSTKYKISFVVALGEEPLTGATISVFADSARSIPVADYSSVYPGTYYYTITKELFEPFTGSVVITDSDEEIEVTLVEEDIGSCNKQLRFRELSLFFNGGLFIKHT